jgi:hypothetical protein
VRESVSSRFVLQRAVVAVCGQGLCRRGVSREQWSRSREQFRVVAGEIWRYLTFLFAYLFAFSFILQSFCMYTAEFVCICVCCILQSFYMLFAFVVYSFLYAFVCVCIIVFICVCVCMRLYAFYMYIYYICVLYAFYIQFYMRLYIAFVYI